MMKYQIFLTCLIYGSLAAPSNVEDSLRELSIGNRNFAADVYKQILKTNQRNFIFSPFSVETILALASEGARGDTRMELVTALHLSSSQEASQKAFKELLPKLAINSRRGKLYTANKIFADDGVAVDNNFKKVAVDAYRSGVETVNFEKNVEASNTINNWVEKQTNGKIKEIIKSDEINANTALVLVNALYLSAKWPVQFKERNTRMKTFYKSATETVELPTMSKVDYFKYYDSRDLAAQFLELKYKIDGLSMVIMLPNEKEGLKTIESNIEKVFEPKQWKLEAMDLKLPRFAVESDVPLVGILKSLGAKKIFDKNECDLSGIAPGLYVSDVVQKACINVTESGTEAAAATALLIESRSGRMFPPSPKLFDVDHPFVYFIKYKEMILFAGKYSA